MAGRLKRKNIVHVADVNRRHDSQETSQDTHHQTVADVRNMWHHQMILMIMTKSMRKMMIRFPIDSKIVERLE